MLDFIFFAQSRDLKSSYYMFLHCKLIPTRRSCLQMKAASEGKGGSAQLNCRRNGSEMTAFPPQSRHFDSLLRRMKNKVFLGKRWKFGFMREFCVVFLLWQGEKHSNGCSIASIFNAVTVKIRRKRPHIIRTFNASFCDDWQKYPSGADRQKPCAQPGTSDNR